MRTALPAVIEQIRRLAQAPVAADASDRQLLRRFAAGRDEAAFAALVRRHGPMVLGVCRRVLGNAADAEDAFQATFLVLARKADSPRWHDSVGGWLHQVARRVAREARDRAARRRGRERTVADLPDVPAPAAAARELGALLDEELGRLPERYRGPLLLCYLEGTTRDRAAALLGLSLRTLERRLQRGRALLRARLARRGLTLTALLAAALVGEVPATFAALAGPTVKTSAAFAAGSLATAGEAASHSVVLAQAVLASTALTKARAALLLVLALTLGLAGAATMAGGPPGAEPQRDTREPVNLPSAKEEKAARVGRPGDSLPPGAVARLGGTQFRHGIDVRAVAFTPDGSQLASVAHDSTACLWDAATGRELRRFTGPLSQKPVWGLPLAVSPDARLVAWADPGEEAVIGLYDLASGEEMRRLRGHRVQIHALVFAPDGKTLASAAGDRTVRLWDVAGGRVLHRIGPLPQGCEALVYSSDGKTLIGAGPTAYLWDATTAREVFKLDAPRNRRYPIVLSADGKLLASGVSYDDSKVYLWDAATGQQRRALEGHRGGPSSLAFSPDGRLLASGGADRTIRLWDLATGKEVRKIAGHQMTVHSLAFSPDGKRLASGSMDATVGLWDVATGADLRPQVGHAGAVTALSLSPDGRRLASGSYDQTIRLWDLVTGKETRRLPGPEGDFSRVSFAADGKTLASVGQDGSLRRWDTGTGKEVEQPAGHHPEVVAAAFSPDGRVLMTAGEGGILRVWDTPTNKELRHAEGGLQNATCLDSSPDGRLFAAGSRDGWVALWNTATGKELHRVKASGDRIHVVACSPDGKLLAWAGLGQTIYLTDMATGERCGELSGHQEAVTVLAFAADGKGLVSASADKTIRVWELATRKERHRLRSERSLARALALAGDGRTCLSGHGDGTVLIWDLWADGGTVPPSAEWPATRGEALWADLASADAAQGYRAMRALAGAEQGVSLLREKVRPAAAVDPRRLTRLVADLDDDEFDVREKAAQELESLGELAAPALRQALTGRPSAEVRRRAETLLAAPHELTAEQLRGLRAVEVLERARSAEARPVLESLAAGAAAARLTQEAKSALARLAPKREELRKGE
jgi:RNA polymerase sigma factor (sigma-70 family)